MDERKELIRIIKFVHKNLVVLVIKFSFFVTHSIMAEPCHKVPTIEVYNKIHQYLEDERHFLDKDLNIKKVACHCGVTKKQLNEELRAKHNLAFSGYINKLRLEYSCVLLLDPSDKLMEVIAEEACFKTLRTFNRNFKARYNIPPSTYRCMYRLKDSIH